jgi:hypothetical protein
MKPNEWSGLAPAVDAHLSRWARSDKVIKLAQRFDETRSHDDFAPWIETYIGHAWTAFAASYGVPGADGVPRADLMTLDGETIAGRQQMRADQAAIMKGVVLAIREHEMLSKAVSHYVSAEVVQEITEAAHIARNEPLYETDVFTPHGFAVFETPIAFDDLYPETGHVNPDLEVHIRAIGWTTIDAIGTTDPDDLTLKPGVMVYIYTTREDYANGYYRSCRDLGLDAPAPDEIADGFLPLEVCAWQFGRPWGVRDSAAHVPGTVPSTVAAERRWFYAFQRLMWQRIIVPHRPEMKRPERRRLDRVLANRRRPDLDYTVLRLRRAVDPVYERALGTGLPLEHRVRVRGHWKFAYLPGTGLPARDDSGAQIPESHRWTWIEAHWKGPEDGPLGAMDAATAVIR